ncbi:MAG TPA: fumarylacetoacetate hydrolase family protein [Thermoplasmata archaeon]|nr:fumarylacetoacetate hydrolase family protein [Thermoplasmata archaeon]
MAELWFTDGRRLRVGKILGAARNYREHAKEMTAAVPREPVFFLKPATSVIASGEDILLPPQSADVHVETELAAVLTAGGRDLDEAEAGRCIGGYAVTFDITARDLQEAAKRAGLPWTASKGFDTFAPIGEVMPASRVRDPSDLRLLLRINGRVQQDASTADMVFPPAALVAHASRLMTLEAGDVFVTGTPAGVCAIHPGDVLEGEITGLPILRCLVRARRSSS